jgi:predicted transcriptional regulator
MDVLWKAAEPVGVRHVLNALNKGRPEPLAYTTVMTVMARLAQKGALRRERVSRGYVYEAAVADAAAIAVRDVVREHGQAAVAHFLEEARSDPELLERLRHLMQDGSDG